MDTRSCSGSTEQACTGRLHTQVLTTTRVSTQVRGSDLKQLLSLATLVALIALPVGMSLSAPGAGPEALVEAEHAFAQAADAGTVRDAFLAFLAPSAPPPIPASMPGSTTTLAIPLF